MDTKSSRHRVRRRACHSQARQRTGQGRLDAEMRAAGASDRISPLVVTPTAIVALQPLLVVPETGRATLSSGDGGTRLSLGEGQGRSLTRD